MERVFSCISLSIALQSVDVALEASAVGIAQKMLGERKLHHELALQEEFPCLDAPFTGIRNEVIQEVVEVEILNSDEDAADVHIQCLGSEQRVVDIARVSASAHERMFTCDGEVLFCCVDICACACAFAFALDSWARDGKRSCRP